MTTMKKVTTLSLAVLFISALGVNASFAGKPTGGGGGKKVAVESATPNTVVQTAEEDVTIRGSGFDNGSKVKFLVTGTDDDTQIEVVGDAQYISSTELKVHIKTTGSTATVDYDIEVQATSGRKGKGTTLFKVQQAEAECSESDLKEPTIAYLTGLDTSGDIHTQDLYLSTSSGCDQYLLLEDAVQFIPDSGSGATGEYLVNITDLRLDIEGDMGVVVWRDRSIDPIPQYALTFTMDSFGNINPNPNGPEPVHVPAGGYGARGADVRISGSGEVELVMIERAPDDSEWRISYVNVDSGTYLILSDGTCQVEDALGECFIPIYAQTWWNEDGSQIYFDTGNWPTLDRMAIARIQRINGLWQPTAEILMTHYASLGVIGLRSDGLLAYEREEFKVKGKRVVSREWVTASIFPENCVDPEPECLPSDGTEMAADGTKFPRGWTRNGGMLFIETGPGNQKNLREYSNPFNGSVGRLNLRDVDRDQRDTTY